MRKHRPVKSKIPPPPILSAAYRLCDNDAHFTRGILEGVRGRAGAVRGRRGGIKEGLKSVKMNSAKKTENEGRNGERTTG